MDLTDFHAKYFAYELTKRSPSDSVEKLVGALADAQVDLNPHQVDAALFAFRNPFSRGAILADEVGLGKTIEAGLLLSQHWAERKRKLLIILPANLRKQWSQELSDKFHLPSVILESRSFNEAIRAGNLNPFAQSAIVLCSFQFARTKEPYIRQIAWDLIVIDEAHRLRNVYKASSRIALAIKNAVAPFPKVLLTATPLQNSLLELYGLVSIIDDYAFGDLNSFRTRFARLSSDSDFSELKERLSPICKRTLRRQVLEYVPYTNRHALVQEFEPNPDEQRLYDLVSDYLQQPTLYALPASQRQLMTLILRKLLASSTYAISSTLAVVDLLSEHRIERLIRRDRDERPNHLKKEIVLGPEFQELWNRIKHKTTYRVEFETDTLVHLASREIRRMARIEAPHVTVSAGRLVVRKGGVDTAAVSVVRDEAKPFVHGVPDILAYLQNETELTRSTLVRILKESGRLDEFFLNPQRYMDQCAAILRHVLHGLLVDGIKYEKIAGGGPESEWEMMRFEDQELVNFLTAQEAKKSIYEYVPYDSEIERDFARMLDERSDIRLFVKLPRWFKVETPVGDYNPDWAIVKQQDQTVYLVRETKGTRDFLKLRTSEADKVRCGQRHFEALGVNFAVAVSADEV